MSTKLDSILLRNHEHNKLVLKCMQSKLMERLSNKDIPPESFVRDLYKEKMDEDWLLAQCQSASNQINKILDQNSKFLGFYDNVLTEGDKISFAQEIVFDLHYLDRLSGYKISFEDRSKRVNYLPSQLLFMSAKFSFFTRKYIQTQRDLRFAAMPALIRQAIELKVKEMIGLDSVKSKDGDYAMAPISKLLGFFQKHPDFLDLPIRIEVLASINRWTNTFVHTGIIPFCWQSLEAIDLIEDLFSIKDERTGMLHIDGFSYLREGCSIEDLKRALDKYCKVDFSLNAKSIVGGRVR